MNGLLRWLAWRLDRPPLSEGRFARAAWLRARPGGCRGRACSEMHTYRRGCVLR